MKRTNKILAVLVSAAMFSGIMPAIMSSAEDINLKTSAGVAFEDFEDYDVGVIAESAGNHTFGNFEFTLYANDKIEIAEENGNKYLKITRGSTSGSDTTIRYNFSEVQKEGTVTVSYDFIPEESSKNFQGFGVLEKEDKGVIQNIITYNKDVYVDGNLTAEWYVSNILGHMVHSSITQSVEINGDGSQYVFTANSTTPENENKVSTKTRTVNADSVGSIRWSIRNHSVLSHNGPDKNEDASNAGIYRIDNIAVGNILNINEAGKIVEDFDGYTEGTGVSDGNSTTLGYVTLTAPAGDKVSIEKDPTTNSNALKFEKGDNTSALYAAFDFGDVSGKKIKVSFDVRFENHSKLVRNFPSLGGVKSWGFFKYGIWWNYVGGGNTMAGSLSAEDKDNYTNITLTYDPTIFENNVTSTITRANGEVQNSSDTAQVKDFGVLSFSIENAIDGGTNSDYFSHMGPDSGTGIYWIDNVSIEYVSLNLLRTSIKDGETNVPYNRNLTLTFNEPVADNAKDSIMIAEGDTFLTEGVNYFVNLSDDKKIITISAPDGWKYETSYSVMVSPINAQESMTPLEGTMMNFVTGKYTPYLVNDYFDEFEIGQKWEGPLNLQIGSSNQITLHLTEGDSVEFAYDDATGQNGFKLRKGSTEGSLEFIYSFPETYNNGKYTVKVDERIQNYSKGFNRWPSMLSQADTGEIERGIVGAGGYWLGQTGRWNGTDRWGVDWSGDETSRYITGYPINERTEVIGELTTGLGYRYGLHNLQNDNYYYSLEPATETETLGGVLMRIKEGGTPYQDGWVPGTQVDEDTENNPNNDAIAWIYGVTVEKAVLDVETTSFENSSFNFDPSGQFTITFNEKLDSSTVTPETVLIYKNGELVTSYEYSVRILEDGKTILVDVAEGIMYGTTYTINVTKAVKAEDTRIGEMVLEKSYTIKTEEYEDNVNPDIVWSTIPDGSENIDPLTQSIILRTDVLLDQSTINKSNVKVYENDSLIDNYTVTPSGLFAIEVGFDALKKDSVYKITVTGLKSGGESNLPMTQDYTMQFTTRGDIYTSNVDSTISADGTKSQITAELHNACGSDVNYQTAGVLKDADGKILSITTGSSGILSDGDVCDIIVEADTNPAAESFELYIWDSLDSMKPLTKKITTDSVNQRTYGYDNYIDPQKPLNIGFIGGSITQQGQYTTPLMTSLNTFLRQDNPDRQIKYNVEGVGGTGSDLGLYRLEKDIISTNPDIVFIEFAVNDAGSSVAQQTMEGMIRKLMKLEHQPMVILLDLTTENHSSLAAIEAWQPLMSEYEIGYVNVAEYLIANEASQSNPDGFVWKTEYLSQYPEATALTGSDGVHPNADGGKIYANYINEVLTSSPEVFFKTMNYVENPVSGVEYNNPRMIPWSAAQYDTNWTVNSGMNWAFEKGMAQATSSGATLTYKFTGTAIGLYLPKSTKATSAAYSIDNGAYTGNVSGTSGVTTEMPMASMIKSDLADGEHTITITVNNADNLDFKFGYFMVD